MTHLYHDETPPDDDYCPSCGEPLNFMHECPGRRWHEDPTESYRDGDMPWCP